MAMKLNKETLVKHQFWFLLGSFILVWLIATIVLTASAGEPIQKAKADYEKATKEINGAKAKRPKNDTFFEPWRKHAALFQKHKDEIWGEAWQLQKGMYDWPRSDTAPLEKLVTPQVPMTYEECDEYKRVLYPEQVKAWEEYPIIAPAEYMGGFKAVFGPQEFKEVPTREECWLTQEDFWVKRDLLYVVRQTIDSVAYMAPVQGKDKKEDKDKKDDKDEKKDDKEAGHLRFRNINWEIDLVLEPARSASDLVISPKSKIRNVHPSRRGQSLANARTGRGVTFRFVQGNKVADIELTGEPVAWSETAPLRVKGDKGKDTSLPIDFSDPKKNPYLVLQVFDWDTSPVRRVDTIKVPYQSSRTASTPLKANETLAKLDAPKEDPNAPAGGPTGGPVGGGAVGGMPGGGAGGMPGGMAGGMPGGAGGMPGGMPGGAGGAGAGPEGGRGGAAAGNLTPNNQIDRNRYLQAPKEGDQEEKPSRHLPFAMRVVLDQNHIHDFLTALANSRLRVQITQTDFHHVRNVRAGSTGQVDPSDAPAPFGGMVMPGMPAGMPGMPGGAGMPAGMPTMPGSMRGMPPRMPGGRGRPRMQPMPMPMPMPMPGTGAQPTGGAGTTPKARNDDDPNLVELSVYGIATLYRYPQKKPEQQQQ
jgi:hypothetical protein